MVPLHRHRLFEESQFRFPAMDAVVGEEDCRVGRMDLAVEALVVEEEVGGTISEADFPWGIGGEVKGCRMAPEVDRAAEGDDDVGLRVMYWMIF